jgi:hypothetical protein
LFWIHKFITIFTKITKSKLNFTLFEWHLSKIYFKYSKPSLVSLQLIRVNI